MLRVSSLVTAGALSILAASAAEASPSLVSCFKPNNHIAGLLTPNPRHLPIVANKQLPFGTIVRFTSSRGSIDSIVKDRGPYVARREYDLECWVLSRLGVDGVGTVDAKVVGR